MLAALVRAHARNHPDRTALVAGPDRLTYAALDDRMAGLARRLRAHGVGLGSLVGVHLDRGVDVVVALLAALDAGAAYTVIEPQGSLAECADRLATAGPDLVLTSQRYRDALTGRGLRVLEPHGAGPAEAGPRPPDRPAVGADDVAYVLYTSGSTGRPKGVQVTHGNIRHYTEALLERLGIGEPLSYAHVTTLAADLGNTSLFAALASGGTLHLVDDDTRRDPASLLRYLRTEAVDVLKTTPSHFGAVFRAFGGGTAPPVLRVLLLGGELLSLSLARDILASGITGMLVNHYGPTETTVGVAAHVLRHVTDLDAPAPSASVPIGTPLGATRLFVRTAQGVYRERDAVGELYVAGPSLALGYRDDPAATAAAFTDDLAAVEPGLDRCYRTGDRVAVDAAGVLEFLGRGDRQVKIRGYRVELGHVEAGLRRLPGVRAAVAVLAGRQRPALLAAVTLDGTDPAPNLRERARDVLPTYMVPERIAVLDAFPQTANGKTDVAALRRLIEQQPTRSPQPGPRPAAADDPLLAEVHAVWRRHLGHGDFGPHDDFHALGGSSLDAIGVIADLQAAGHRISAAAFLAEPTPAALARRLASGRDADPAGTPAAAPMRSDDTALSPAQEWFFAQGFAQPDQWNQALLLDVDADVRTAELAAAVRDTVALHPMLRTAYRKSGSGRRRVVTGVADVFSVSDLPADPAAVPGHLREVAAARQAELSVTGGTVFKAHLFRAAGQAHLLLLGHHLSVDAVSWRILVGDITRCYRERLGGREPVSVPAPVDFGTWATHLREHAPALRADLAYWEGTDRHPAVPTGDGDNLEADAQAIWWRLSSEETGALARAAATTTGTPLHAALLGAFAHALAGLRGTDEVMVDVESYGRAVFDDAVEISRVVGWFTSTFPIRVDVVDDVDATTKSVTSALENVPHLGVAYGLHHLPRRADVCFNYLGAFALPYDDLLRPTLSRHQVGPVRGPRNDRTYGLKLTARIHAGQLVADLSYSARRHPHERMLALARATHDLLLELCGGEPAEGHFVTEHGSSTGLLAQVPRELELAAPAGRATRDYRTVLLTGASGFIGTHLLHLLVTRTTARIYCLVRPRGGPADDRLRAAYGWYDLGGYGDRVTVLTGDLSEPGFGLAERDRQRLGREVEAIYHLAGETRLFGDRETFERHNVAPVRALIELATTGRPKDLHHVSTLAVCGRGPDGDPVVFAEDSLDVGQSFLNEYEQSKYAAERLVHEFAARGGTAFVYRSGNVAGHSRTGRFQRNGGDNRLIQLLRGAVAVGRVPRVGHRTLALSPVDVVAEGIFAISRSTRVGGGTFHVDTHREVSYDEIFAALRELGCVLADDDAPDFATLFGRYLGADDGDERLAPAYFWAVRPERNVRYDHSRTRRLLDELGVRFPVPDRAWLRDYFSGLIEQDRGSVTTTGVRHD
ncbi:amino acid adenylation domain-containing protein [Micromonospora sp. DT233]|uniref:amino acid adenylation domain-containing protein n=1 Tax=Micromonospora sp. DT233 TaxID=3393432 RepID=UPI003CFA072F